MLSLPQVTVPPEEEVTVSLDLALNGEEVHSVDATIAYDPMVATAVTVTQGALVAHWSVATNLGTPGVIQAALAGAQPVSSGGELLRITFLAIGDEGAATALSFTRGELDEGRIPVNLYDGLLSVQVPTSTIQSIALEYPWNLISMHVEPHVPLIDQALDSIAGAYDRLLAENGIFDISIPITYHTLSEVHAGMGYYLRLTETGGTNLVLEGVRVPVTTPVALHAGWDWIGYLPDACQPITDALQSIEGSYLLVHSLDKTYNPGLPEYSTLLEMCPGEGYLIRVSEPVTLTYPAEGGSSRRLARATAKEVCTDVAVTPYFTLVYGEVTLNGRPALPGTSVEVWTPRGEVAGCFEVQRAGHYGFMHVYGEDDTADPVIPGFREGQPLRFRVNGTEAAVSEGVLWQDDKQLRLVDLSVNARQLFLPMIVAQM